jgi:hypothetical protein
MPTEVGPTILVSMLPASQEGSDDPDARATIESDNVVVAIDRTR